MLLFVVVLIVVVIILVFALLCTHLINKSLGLY